VGIDECKTNEPPQNFIIAVNQFRNIQTQLMTGSLNNFRLKRLSPSIVLADKILNFKLFLPNLFKNVIELQDSLARYPDNVIESLGKWSTDFFVDLEAVLFP